MTGWEVEQMIVLIDNYDSFSYNLYQLIGVFQPDITVIRNDVCTLEEIEAMKPEAIVLSPGPGRPENAGVCQAAAAYFAGKVPVMGVCLGHQAICQAFGGVVSYAPRLMHGKVSDVKVDTESLLFKGLPPILPVARYHSLAAVADSLPQVLKVTAMADDGSIMAVEHREYPVFGLQFHPESVMTPAGKQIMENFINIIKKSK